MATVGYSKTSSTDQPICLNGFEATTKVPKTESEEDAGEIEAWLDGKEQHRNGEEAIAEPPPANQNYENFREKVRGCSAKSQCNPRPVEKV